MPPQTRSSIHKRARKAAVVAPAADPPPTSAARARPDGEHVVRCDKTGTLITNHWKNGLKDGLERIEIPRVQMVVETVYVNGKKHGMHTMNDPRMNVTQPYVDDKEHGVEITRHHASEGGDPHTSAHVTEIPYVNGVIHGIATHRYCHEGHDNIYLEEYKDGTKLREQWIFRTLDDDARLGRQPVRVAADTRREMFGKLTEVIEGLAENRLQSSEYKTLYDAAHALHVLL